MNAAESAVATQGTTKMPLLTELGELPGLVFYKQATPNGPLEKLEPT